MEHSVIQQYQKTFDGLEIEHCKRHEPCSMDLYHYHSSYEIYYLLSGVRNYFIRDRVYRVEKGDIVLINKNDLHKTTYQGSHTHERILINFSDAFASSMQPLIADVDVLKVFSQDINVIKLSKIEQTSIEQILFRIIKESKEAGMGSMTYIKLSMLELLILAARCASQESADIKNDENHMHAKIADIIRYVNSAYMEDPSLKKISEAFYISPFYLSRLFKQTTGFTYIEYLNSIRIKEAQRLLETTELCMNDIAYKIGYESATHFGRVFKQIAGISPLKYRKITRFKD